MSKSKFFRVAVEGATCDGRTIDGKSLTEMAATYNRETYAARVNLEHIRGVTADGPFQAYGDVLALKTEEIELSIGGKNEKRLALFAEIDALDPLVAMNKKGQKLYSSVEISPNFANTGKAYLVGLAVTDSPASLGTEVLQFRIKQGDTSAIGLPLTNLFSTGLETELTLIDEPALAADPTGIFASIKGMLDKFGTAPAAPAAVVPPKTDEPAASAANPELVALSGVVGQLATMVQAFTASTTAALVKQTGDIAALTATLEATPKVLLNGQRPVATGGEGNAKTDC